MRSPVIAFSIFAAAAAVSPTLVGAAPTSPNLNGLAAAQGVPGAAAGAAKAPHVPAMVRDLSDKHNSRKNKHDRRVDDYQTSGGNAYSGASGAVSGGNVINEASSDDDTITNTGASK